MTAGKHCFHGICCLRCTSARILGTEIHSILSAWKVTYKGAYIKLIDTASVFCAKLHRTVLGYDIFPAVTRDMIIYTALKSLEQTLKNIEQQRMEDNLTMSKSGNELAESPLDEVARMAKADIILELSWEMKDFGPKHSLTYILEARDAYTAKTIGSSAGTGAPSISADVDVLLEEAIVANMDNLNNRLMDHFTEMQNIGREISLDIKVFANNARGIDLESEFGGEELVDLIETWLQLNTVQGRFTREYSSENVARFTQVRIPVYDERGRAIDANGFAKQLTKHLKGEPFYIPAKVLVKGLGRAVIILGEK